MVLISSIEINWLPIKGSIELRDNYEIRLHDFL